MVDSSTMTSSTALMNEIDPYKPLTKRQKAFVEHLSHPGITPKQAAGLAGFKAPLTSAHDLVKRPNVQQAIRDKQKRWAIEGKVSKEEVIEGFKEAFDVARLKAEPLAMVASYREIARVMGYYEDGKVKVTVDASGKVQYETLINMTEEQLLEIIREEENKKAIEGTVE